MSFNRVKLNKFTVYLSLVIMLLLLTEIVYADRFFKKKSTWYELIPDNAISYNEGNGYNSDAIIADFASNDGLFYINNYTRPVYIGDAQATASPTNVFIYNNNCADGSCPALADQNYDSLGMAHIDQKAAIEDHGWNVGIPIPAEARTKYNDFYCNNPSKWRDNQMLVYNQDKTVSWSFIGAVNCTAESPFGQLYANKGYTGGWAAVVVRKFTNVGDGVEDEEGPLTYNAQSGPQPQYDYHASPGGGVKPWQHGLLTYDEVVNDRIDHALLFVYCCSKNSTHWGIYPAVSYKGAHPNGRTNSAKYGMRFQLNPNFDIDAYVADQGLSIYHKRILLAMQQYGMIYIDSNGDGGTYRETTIIAERLDWSSQSHGGLNGWGDIFTPSQSFPGLDGSDFRVINPLLPPFAQTYQCSDGIDNDSDGTIDYPDDPGCSSATDNDESSDSINNSIASLKTTSPVTIDGYISEDEWNYTNFITFTNSSKSDNEVKVRTMWDDTNLYFAYEVTDVNIESLDSDLWSDDGIAIYIDTLNNASSSMDADDYQFVINTNDIITGGNLNAQTASSANGYITEVAVPWSAINVTPSSISSMGLLLTNNDRDNSVPSHFDWLNLIESGNYVRPNLWGDINISQSLVASTDTVPPGPPFGLFIQ